MSQLSNFLHQIAATAQADVVALKNKLASLEPEIAAGFADVVNGAEATANALTQQAASAVQTEAAQIPVFGAVVAQALATAAPTVVSDLKSAYAQLGSFLEGLEETAVEKLAGS